LVGSNLPKNLTLLTAREHYLCHWLLVKRYEVGSIERKKMIKAWFMMAAKGKNLQRPIINMNTYAKYKKELSQITRESQNGKLNSQYGKHWFTNRNTGECRSFINPPNNIWILGRNLFKGETSNISKMMYKYYQCKRAEKIWNEYHSGNYTSIRDYCRKHNELQPTINNLFKKYIPIYNKIFKSFSQHNSSKIEYVNVFK